VSKPIRQQFADTMLALGQDDPELVVLVGDISHFALQPFAQACPGRYYNVGICEPTIISMAAGLAKVGLYPVVHTIAPFIVERGFEQIKLDFCYHKLGGNLVTVGGVFDYSTLGCTHHCYGDFALLKTLPGAQITYPSSCLEFDLLFRQAYRNDQLTLFRVPGTAHEVELDAASIQFGKGIRVVEGADLTIVAVGPQLRSAMAAHAALEARGWRPEVLYIHTARPLDAELIRASAAKTRRVLVIEEHMRSGGLGDEVLRETHQIGGVSYAFLAVPDVFVRDYASYEEHCARLGLSAGGIVREVEAVFGSSPEKQLV